MNDFAARVATLSAEKQKLLARLIDRDGGALNAFQLSFAQERLWFLDRLVPGSTLYNSPTAVRFSGALDVGVLSRSWSELVRRHEVLRTCFATLLGRPLQVVSAAVPQALPVVDLRALPPARRDAAARELAAQESRLPFDLEIAPLARVTLLHLAAGEHVVLLTLHHIISDGWSVGVLLQELTALYAAFQAGRPSPLPALPIQYKDFARWQRGWLAGERLEAEVEYWQRQLAGAPPQIELPTDRPRPAVQSFRGAVEWMMLPRSIAADLGLLAARRGATLFQVLLAAFGALLMRHSRQTDVLLGTAVANRSRPELEGLIGFFVNTLMLRLDLSGDPTFRELVERVREVTLEAFAHQDLPFEKLVEALHPERSLSRNPIFQAAFDLQNLPLQPVNLPGLRLSPVEVESRISKLDLRLSMRETPQGLACSFEYASDLFDRTSVQRLGEHFRTLLAAIGGDGAARLSQLDVLTGAERHQALREWNDSAREEEWAWTAHRLFEEQADRAPQALAVVFAGESLTYGELDRRANRLARHLIALGAGPEALVGLCVERSLDMIVAILGVLKSGAAYLPLDPGNPRERLGLMIEDSRAPLLVTHERLLARLPESVARIVLLDKDRDAMDGLPASRPAVSVTGENLAYVIYTSGSTGKPKGAWLTHRSLCNLAFAFIAGFDLGPGSRILQFSFFNFDASVVEIFMTLLGGTTLHLARQDELVPGPGLVALLRERRITAAIIPPSVLAAVPETDLPDFRTLIVAGEACSAELVARWAAGRRFYNAYGPTEATVCASFTPCFPGGGKPHIGRPIHNVQTYVLDRLSHPVPAGVPGELHIGGVSVGRGYLGRPDLTAEKFIPDPFGEPGARLYCTGDLARLLPDGSLDFLGRIDHQVKVRGFRIELGEIEETLRRHPAVRQAAVAALGEGYGERRVVAWVVPAAAAEASERELRDFLAERLPQYMVPAAVVAVDALPLNSSGKLDLAALPDPRGRRPAGAEFRPPQTALEKTIAGIWSEVLEVERVGLHDNFFDLGGHSLLVARMHARLREELGLDLALIDLFTYPTVSSLAARLHRPEPETAALAPAAALRTSGSGEAAVAIVGMSLRVSGAAGLEEFWANLCGGVETIRFFTDEELLAAGIAPTVLRNPNYIKAGAYLEGMDLFDAAFFGINPRQATVMDPQQRIFLECAWEALEHAGYAAETYPGKIGVYAGAGANSYMLTLFSNPDFVESVGVYQTALGNDKDHLATRTSYFLNLQGPSVTVQTSCSTSLVAVHLACRSLLGGECDAALAGGVSIDAKGKSGYFFQEGGIRSPDGHCRAFDAQARGAMNGSGAGIVVLKRLADALRDGDTIHAVLRGSAINNDGSAKIGYTAPRIESQAQVIREAQIRAGVTADEVTYVEAHGTGTELGDPIEVAALTRAFRETTEARGYCALGSIKASIGHLDAAAGVAGLIKATLAVQRGQIPPSLHFKQPNPKIDFANSPFFVNDQLREWRTAGPRRVGVSSFGIGGTNAHVVLEEPPAAPAPASSRPVHLLVMSARTASALEKASENLARHLETGPEQDLADVEYTLQAGRRLFPHRRFAVCRDTREAVAALSGRHPGRTATVESEARNRGVVFLFSGHGSQFVDMGRELYEHEPVYRDAVDRCADYLEPSLGLDLRRILYPDPDAAEGAMARLGAMALAQPILFAVEYALAQLWVSWLGWPQAMIGHSMGEYVAACLSGVLSLEGALTLVAARGRLMDETAAGAMLAVPLPEAELLSLLGPDLALGAVNGPSRCVASGPVDAIERLWELLTERGIDCRRLHISIAAHSRLMESIVPRYAEEVGRVALRAPRIPYVSNLTGTWITAEQATDPAYWTDHLRHPVRFADGLREIWRSTDGVLLEVGPGRSLTTLAVQHPERPMDREVLSSLSHPQERSPDLEFVLTSLGRLWAQGVAVDWNAFHAAGRRRVPLPTYPFERRRYWVEPSRSGRSTQGKEAPPDTGFLAPSWRRSEEPQRPGAPVARWLVFRDGYGLGEALERRLTAAGREVVTFREGPDELARELHATGFAPGGIVLGPGLGLRSVRRLLRAFGGESAVRVLLLTTEALSVTGEESLRPEQAPVLGLCGATLPEAPNLRIRGIDVVPPEPGSTDEARLLDNLGLEIEAEPVSSIIAYRGRHRWERTASPVQLIERADPERPDGGSWLILDGLSRSGRQLARRLACPDARLALVGRDVHLDLAAEAASLRRLEETLAGELSVVPLADVAGLEESLDRLCASYALAYLRHGGVDLAAGRSYRREELRRALAVLPAFERLFERLVSILVEDDFLRIEGECVRVACGEAPDPALLRHEAEARFPQFRGIFRLLDHCARHYGPALSGAMPALEVLYPEGRSNLLASVEKQTARSNHQKLYVQSLCQVVAGLARQPGSRGLRILEVGAGSGALSRSLLSALRGARFTYVFSDISAAFVRAAEEKAAEQGLENVELRVLDISRDLVAQGLAPESFDAVLGLNVAHATPSLAQTVGNLQRVVAPGGLLGLIETVRTSRWIDMTWGLAEGWWCFEDLDRRTASPLAAPEVWEKVLRDQRFRHVEVLSRGDTALILGQQPPAGEAAAELAALGAEAAVFPTAEAAREWLGPAPGVAAAADDLETALAAGPLLDGEGPDLLLWLAPQAAGPEAECAATYWSALAEAARERYRRVRLLRWYAGGPGADDEADEVFRQVLRGGVTEAHVLNARPGSRLESEPPITPDRGAPGPQSSPQTDLERQIAGLWEELLGRRVGLHDNFFDLGGDSLIAISLTAKIRQTWQVELPMRRILEAPTVFTLAALVEAALPRAATLANPAAGGSRALPPTVVEIQAGSGVHLPFFTVHAAGGSIFCYHSLAKHLGPERPVYALEPPGLDGAQVVFERLEDLAAHHVASVRAVQPEGPYLVGGWSAGGTIAFEMARQLEAAGQEVALVALMDTYAPVNDYELDDLKMLMWQVWRFKLPVTEQDLRNLGTFEDRLDFLVRRAVAAGIIPRHVPAEEARRMLTIEIANLKAMLNYRPGSFAGELSFFRSREGTDFGTFEVLFPWINEVDHAAAWARLALGQVRVFEVPGDHSVLMDEPNVQVLAERLRECIARAETPREVTTTAPGWPS